VQVASNARSIPLPLARDNVQNGAPDAVGLIHDGRDVLLDALSYEGAIEAATIEGMPGTWNLVEGDPVTEVDTNDETGSLCRIPHGGDSGDDDTDWRACTPTPGATNAIG
jgi:hypothetical protein